MSYSRRRGNLAESAEDVHQTVPSVQLRRVLVQETQPRSRATAPGVLTRQMEQIPGRFDPARIDVELLREEDENGAVAAGHVEQRLTRCQASRTSRLEQGFLRNRGEKPLPGKEVAPSKASGRHDGP